ncbi:DUF3592 domain-containing protein [Chitinophaga lutea]|nr:DUF3592 domain-containing protein [Chitinophaga lutea]
MGYNTALIAGILLLVASCFTLNHSLTLLRSGEKAVGTVIMLEKSTDTDNESVTPIFRFTTRSNEEYTFGHIVSTDPPAWDIGEKGTIIYDPANPSQAKLLTYFSVFSETIFCVAFALPLIVFGGGSYIARYIFRVTAGKGERMAVV